MAGTIDVWDPPDLSGRVVCVSGASYGVGRAVCEVLGQCSATVYVTARSTRSSAVKNPEWTIEDTAELVDDRGGRGIAIRVDFTSETEVAALFERIKAEHQHLDLLVNNVWQWGPIESYWAPSWEQPTERWDAMMGTGTRSLFLAARGAIPLMIRHGGLIIATQERPGDALHFADNIAVDAAVTTMSGMIEYLANELRSTPVATLLVYLGWVRTVNRGMGFDPEAHGMTAAEFEAITQSPYLVGRAVAALAEQTFVSSSEIKRRSGEAVYAGDIALELGFTDIDGRIPSCDGRRDLRSDPPSS